MLESNKKDYAELKKFKGIALLYLEKEEEGLKSVEESIEDIQKRFAYCVLHKCREVWDTLYEFQENVGSHCKLLYLNY